MIRRPPRSPLFPYTPLSRSDHAVKFDPAVLGGRAPDVLQTHGRSDDAGRERDRKSTRLNSSHGYISYAVFCLKKKKDIDHKCIFIDTTQHNEVLIRVDTIWT